MNSLILRTASRFLLPMMLVFSVFLLLRGHNEPGGGFAGGLTGAAAFALYAIAYGPGQARRLLRWDPHEIIGFGLGLAILSGLPALLMGESFLAGKWFGINIVAIGALDLGTPILFDVGVYLVVLGTVLLITLTLAEED